MHWLSVARKISRGSGRLVKIRCSISRLPWLRRECAARVCCFRPLLLSIPLDGRYFDRFGVGRESRDLYYKRIRALAQQYHISLVDFEEHDEDEDFLAGHHDHLSEKGWLYFDKALDDFFHDRLAATPAIR